MTVTPHILLILSHDADEYAGYLRQADLPGLEVRLATNIEAAEPAIGDADIVLGNPSWVARVLPQARSLAWVQSTFAGVAPLCQPGLRRDYQLTTVRDVFGPLMSEYVFLHLLARERQLAATWRAQAQARWEPMSYRGLGGQTLGVCGLGSIGRHIAATARHFGMRVLGYRQHDGDSDAVDRVYRGDELPGFLASLDYLVLVLPQTPQTHHLIDATALSQLRPDATLINVGRGDSVDEAALVSALASGKLRHAILDVFEQEPLPPDSPLWQLPNVTLTPHSSARSFPADIAALFAGNYRRYCRSQPLNYVVDFVRGY